MLYLSTHIRRLAFLTLISGTLLTPMTWAQSAADCQARAKRAQMNTGTAGQGAFRGAARGAIFGGIVGGSKSAGRGAALGLLVGGARQNAKSQNIYRSTYDSCMATRRKT